MKVGFNTPFAEQLEFFRQKLNLPTEHWDDILRSAHDRAFIVAGAAKADLLADLRAAVEKTIGDGKSIGWFRKEFSAIVGKHGWQGWTGEGSPAGFAWRTRVIYQTNLATSYAAGRYRQLTDPDLLKLRPYWRYKHADGVMNPRLQHVAWNGLTLPHDHPFWQTHFPPNGWGCHCRIVPVDAREYAKSRAAGETEPPAGWDDFPEGGDPPGVARGFGYAPGSSNVDDLRALAAAKAKNVPGSLARAFADDVASVRRDPVAHLPDCDGADFASSSFAGGGCLAPTPGQTGWKDAGRLDLRRVPEGLRLERPLILPPAETRGGALLVMARALQLSPDAPLRAVRTPVETALLRYDSLPHLVEKEADARERYANFILPTLQDPYEIWGVKYADGTRNRYIGLFKGERDFMVVLRVNLDGSLMWNVMHAPAKKMNGHRIGGLLYGK